MYGFPAGRPFRVIGREAGFVQIQDLKSSASGWIDEAALAPPPRRPFGRGAVAIEAGHARPEAGNRIGRPEAKSGQESRSGDRCIRTSPRA